MRGSSEAAAADAEKARREARAAAAAAAEVVVDIIEVVDVEDEAICWLASRRAAAVGWGRALFALPRRRRRALADASSPLHHR